MTETALVTEGYRRAARITREHGTTYYWGVLLLPRPDRKHVHAVYALCRLADDIVDAPGANQGDTTATRAALDRFHERVDRAVAGHEHDDPVLAAVGATIARTGIATECLDRFFGAMAMDLDRATYATWDDLLGYMEGSAAVIGEMMLPVLRPRSPSALAPARSLGFAFQYTNFLRDVAEDLDRGRIYLPADVLAEYGADPRRRTVDESWRAFMRAEIARNRALYAEADAGIAYLPPRAARCVATARRLYSRILDRIEAADYDVFSGRVRVPTWQKAATAAAILVAGPPKEER